MTRIVAGSLGGRTLAVPSKGTRPTSERVREAIFSRLEHAGAIEGAVVLDLFAGSGALGLEACSRGAARAVLVDSSRRAVEVIGRNIRALGAAAVARQVPALRYAQAPADGPFSLVFCDPPYDLAEDALTEALAALVAANGLTDDAVVVVERSSRSPEPRWPAGLTPAAARPYGETIVYFADRSVAPSPTASRVIP